MVESTLLQALKDARAKETAHLEAIFRVQDVAGLRLMALHDSMLPEIARLSGAADLFELQVEQGSTPRLWLGLNASIVMEPDPKTYRLIELQDSARQVLFETQDVNQMRRFGLRHMAFAAVAHGRKPKIASRHIGLTPAMKLALTWLFGLFCGVFAYGLYAFMTGLFHWQ